jgi:acyl carrier protein
MQDLEREISELIVSSLNLEPEAAARLDPELRLFGEGLGLDSIDALEMAMALRRRFGVTFQASDEENRKVFESVRTLARYVAATRTQSETP